MPPESSPRSDTRAGAVPPPLPPSEDDTEIREKPLLAPAPDPDLELDDAFFLAGSSSELERAELEWSDLEEAPYNPELSPEQSARRRWLQRQVLLLMVVLAAFSLAVLVPRLPG